MPLIFLSYNTAILLLLYEVWTFCYEKSVDVACAGAKTRDVGRLVHGSSGRKNPRLYKLINKAIYTELVL